MLPILGGEYWHLLQGWQPGQAQETWVSKKGMHSGQPYLVWFISITRGITLSYPYMIFMISHMHFSFVSQHLLISESIALGQVSLGDSSSESRASPLAEETGTGIWYVSVRSSPRAPWLDGCIWQPERFVHANFST